MFRRLLFIGLASMLAMATPIAQSQPTGFPRFDVLNLVERFTDLDRQFLERAAQLHEMELQMATLATTRARDVRIRQLAPHLLRDHEIEFNQLKRIAAERGVTLPGLDDIQQETLDRLRDLDGYLFDRAFIFQIVNEHRDQYGLYRDSSENPNLDLRSYGERRIATIQEHVWTAHRIEVTPVFGRWLAISDPK
jgi:putative membrane protein